MSSNENRNLNFDEIINRTLIRTALKTLAYSDDHDMKERAMALLAFMTNPDIDEIPLTLNVKTCSETMIYGAIKDIYEIIGKLSIEPDKKKQKINWIIKNRKFSNRQCLLEK